MGWLRIVRPGCVIGEQQQYLCKIGVGLQRYFSTRAGLAAHGETMQFHGPAATSLENVSIQSIKEEAGNVTEGISALPSPKSADGRKSAEGLPSPSPDSFDNHSTPIPSIDDREELARHLDMAISRRGIYFRPGDVSNNCPQLRPKERKAVSEQDQECKVKSPDSTLQRGAD